VHVHKVENVLLMVVKHADLHKMEEVRLWEISHGTGTISKDMQSLVHMARQWFGIGCIREGIVGRSIKVVIQPGVLLVRSDRIPKFVLWILAPETYMSFQMI